MSENPEGVFFCKKQIKGGKYCCIEGDDVNSEKHKHLREKLFCGVFEGVWDKKVDAVEDEVAGSKSSSY